MKTFSIVIGWIWTVAATFLWLASMGVIWHKQGFMAMMSLMNPFNIWQFAMTLLLFLPGIIAINYGSKDP